MSVPSVKIQTIVRNILEWLNRDRLGLCTARSEKINNLFLESESPLHIVS